MSIGSWLKSLGPVEEVRPVVHSVPASRETIPATGGFFFAPDTSFRELIAKRWPVLVADAAACPCSANEGRRFC